MASITVLTVTFAHATIGFAFLQPQYLLKQSYINFSSQLQPPAVQQEGKATEHVDASLAPAFSASTRLGDSEETGPVQTYAINRTSSIFNFQICIKSTSSFLPLPRFLRTSFIPVSGLTFHPFYTFSREAGWLSVTSVSPSGNDSKVFFQCIPLIAFNSIMLVTSFLLHLSPPHHRL